MSNPHELLELDGWRRCHRCGTTSVESQCVSISATMPLLGHQTSRVASGLRIWFCSMECRDAHAVERLKV